MSTFSPFNTPPQRGHPKFDFFAPLRFWLDQIEFHNANFAHFVCKLIPCQCPFERNISLLGYVLHIPPLCKLNPLYDNLISLRFRALCYLADTCHEDITSYVC